MDQDYDKLAAKVFKNIEAIKKKLLEMLDVAFH